MCFEYLLQCMIVYLFRVQVLTPAITGHAPPASIWEIFRLHLVVINDDYFFHFFFYLQCLQILQK